MTWKVVGAGCTFMALVTTWFSVEGALSGAPGTAVWLGVAAVVWGVWAVAALRRS